MTIPKSYEALAADLASEKILSKTLLGQKEAYMMLADKGRLDLSESKAREAALREELAMARDDLIIFKSAVSALGEASKKLLFCARTSEGTAGPDQGLTDACAGVEGVITLGGIARAMNEFERLTAERDDLAARLEQARDRKNSIVDLQQRLTVAEQSRTTTSCTMPLIDTLTFATLATVGKAINSLAHIRRLNSSPYSSQPKRGKGREQS